MTYNCRISVAPDNGNILGGEEGSLKILLNSYHFIYPFSCQTFIEYIMGVFQVMLSLEAAAEMELEYKIFIGINLCEKKQVEAKLDQGRSHIAKRD